MRLPRGRTFETFPQPGYPSLPSSSPLFPLLASCIRGDYPCRGSRLRRWLVMKCLGRSVDWEAVNRCNILRRHQVIPLDAGQDCGYIVRWTPTVLQDI